jgi:hypothetical protein
VAKGSGIPDFPSRRAFLVGLTAATALPAVPEAFAATPAPAPPQVSQSGSSDGAQVDALLAILTARFGSYLQSADMPAIRRSLERIRRSAAELQKIPMHNGDAPDCLFHPDGA